jgi:3-methyl-2-oxobutanoate hydroxymethyltransferase
MKMTVPTIKTQKDQKKIKMITAYDTPSAIIADKAGADIILVGDSLMTTVLGYENTMEATMDIMIHHTAAVSRAKSNALIVGYMPWLSYHISVEETLRNAGRFIREGKAEAVKIEGGKNRVETIKALIGAEIPVMGHIGLTPQSIHSMGGYKVQGKNDKDAQKLIEDAKALEKAGVFAIVLEGIPDIVAKKITKAVNIPTIGIGAGIHCDGQVLVFHDVLGLNFGHIPKFVRPYANLKNAAINALNDFFKDIDSGSFPSKEETYHMDTPKKNTK